MTGKRTQEEMSAQSAQFNEASEGLLRLLLEDEPKEALIDRVVTLSKRLRGTSGQAARDRQFYVARRLLGRVHQWAGKPMAQVIVPVPGGEFEDVTVERAQAALMHATECLLKVLSDVDDLSTAAQITAYAGGMVEALNLRAWGTDD